MRRILFFVFVVLLMSGCNTGPKFTVTGEISGAEGEKIYLEASQIGGVVVLDSMKIKKNGTYTFKYAQPESPEFYRLRMGSKIINFSIDTTETVTINAPYDKFETAYEVFDSPNSSKIQELVLKQMQLQKEINTLMEAAQNNRLPGKLFQERLDSLIHNHKEDVKVKYIYAAPNTTAAYFALFQRVNSLLLFDPLNNKEDIRCFAAVATSLESFYPHAERSKNLYNLVIKGMRNTRTPQESVVELDETQIQETGLIDIELRDIRGNVRKLSELAGKVVLLDFTVYQNEASPAHNFMLRDLYDKYADKGFTIYQVSLDTDEHFWKTSANNLPWVCVRDPQSIYSTMLSLYNIQQLPSYFLINKDNELCMRQEDVKDLETTIKSLL